MNQTIPVTVVTSANPSDGARLLQSIRQGSSDVRLHAIVPAGGKRARKKSPMRTPTTPRLKKLGEGCSCCVVRQDVLAKVRQIARQDGADRIVVHAPLRDDLPTLAKTFTVADRDGSVLSDVAQFESLVVLVQTASVVETLSGPGGRGLLDRVQMADVILLDGPADEAATAKARSALQALNADARIEVRAAGPLHVDGLKAEHPFDLQQAQRRSSLQDVLDAEGEASPTRLGFQSRRPFHAGRLAAFLNAVAPRVLRARGSFWVASRPDRVGVIDIAGGRIVLEDGGRWWAGVPAAERPDDPGFRAYVESFESEEFGDRRNDLAFVGLDLATDQLRIDLEACLLTDDEVAAPETWPSLPDPFAWPRR